MKKKELARKITSWLTLGAFSVQPMLAFAEEILPDNNAPVAERPLVTETASGNPLVQITAPTAGGVSVNRYEFFNVPERGAILNNSYGLTSTELAGYVQGNPNLAAGTARIIVNEVTSANPSELRGFLEVAGDRAGIVIANPNGILADGAGFLNTARVTLATGRTEMDASGNLAAIRVEGGNLSVTGKGLNVQGVDSVEIYARAIEINAGLWAKNAKLAAGANEIRYADGTITPIKGTEDTPTYALDLAAIGGMYANRIELIGTEKGLGVNLAGQITSTQATSLDINGNLKTSGNLYTDGLTRIHANEIENSGAVYSKENTVLTASSLQNSGKIVGGADTAIHASAIANSGTLAAVIAPSGKTNEAGTLTVTAKEFDNNNAQLLSGKDIVVSAENMRTQNIRIAGNGDISLVSQNALTVENSTVQSGKDLSIEANAMPLGGNLSSGRNMTIAVKSDLSNEAASENFGNLHAGRNLTANIRGNVYNQRAMNAGGTLSLTADGSLTQTTVGKLSAEHLHVKAADVENHGLIQSKEETILHTAQLKNDVTGGIYGRQINVQAKNGTEEDISAAALYNSGKIISEADTTIHAASVANTGTLAAAIAPSGKANDAGTLTIAAKELSNNGQLLSGKDIVVSAENLRTKSGQIAGNGDVSLTVKNVLDIQDASIQSGRDLSIEASAMPLSGNLSANRDMRLTLHGGLSNEAAAENFGNLRAGRNLTANLQGNVYNQRKLEAGGTLSLATTGSLTQTAVGEISGKNLALHTADMENRGLVQAGEETAITTSNLKNDATGRIYGNTIDVQASHIRNEKNARLEARLAEEMHLLKEKADLLEAAHRVDITKFTSQADIAVYKANIQTAESAYDAQQKVVDAVKAELAALPSGVIAAREALALQANSIQNSGNALLYSGGDLSLAAKEKVANRGARIEAQGNISITAPLTKNENAAFSAKRVITETKDNPVKLRIDEGGHKEYGKAFPAEEFRNIDSGYGAYHSYVALKPIFELAAYKEIRQLSPEEIAAGGSPIPDELIGKIAPNYAYDDPIFERFNVTSMPTARPADDNPAAQKAWDVQYKAILTRLNEKITAYNEEAKAHNASVAEAAGQKIDNFTVIRSYSQISNEKVTSSLPGSIRAGKNILLQSDVENEDSSIIAGNTLKTTGALREDAKKQQELAVTFGTTQGNRLSTGTFSFSGLENGADYSAKSIGAEYHHYGSYDKMNRQEKNNVYNTISLSPNLSMPAKGDANSTTSSAVAQGTIDIRENPTQDISALNRDTTNTLNELGRIFDKQTIEEQQELAKAFGEEAFRLAHNLPDDGSGRKIAVHAIIGGIMSQITGAGFASGAIGAGVNEAVIGEIKKIKDPGTAQIVSAIVGAAAAKAVGGNAGAGATAAASGTKNNNAAVAIPEMALTALVFAMGYVLITDEKGNQSISNTIDGIPKTIAEYSEDIGAWLDTNGDTIGSEIQDFIVWAKSGFELKRMPKDKIDELGGEDFTREVKKQTGKSKSDLY